MFHIHLVPEGMHQKQIYRRKKMMIASEFTIPGAVKEQNQKFPTRNILYRNIHETQHPKPEPIHLQLDGNNYTEQHELAADTWLDKKVTHQGRKQWCRLSFTRAVPCISFSFPHEDRYTGGRRRLPLRNQLSLTSYSTPPAWLKTLQLYSLTSNAEFHVQVIISHTRSQITVVLPNLQFYTFFNVHYLFIHSLQYTFSNLLTLQFGRWFVWDCVLLLPIKLS